MCREGTLNSVYGEKSVLTGWEKENLNEYCLINYKKANA